jgi:hypothetical protein
MEVAHVVMYVLPLKIDPWGFTRVISPINRSALQISINLCPHFRKAVSSILHSHSIQQHIVNGGHYIKDTQVI